MALWLETGCAYTAAMQRLFAFTMVGLGLLMIAGGEYFLAGVGLLALGLYLSGTESTGASEVVVALVAIAGALGVLALFAQFIWQRVVTWLP